ncbi:hypothetical protein FN846DRAFT_926778 [Sphaerosporella brunnea]|uniref:ER transporter 6TM N-terminal domain-containing protein n=1 Tax=Sphaerosporella brunnea TaxID=1250544 RepID=A0A5J5FBC5_9PEZI|nr:hypothetical protein FN846DRAFT_926778 [Sphaerosporella brunnea]
MTSVFGHPGRHLGAMVEALTMATIGGVIGVAWASLGTFLSSLVYGQNQHAAMTIKAVFVMVAAFVHGYVRLSTPRLFLLVLLMLMPVLIGLTSTATHLTLLFPTQFLYPILTAIAVMLLVNVTIFPEFGSSQLCMTTIKTILLAQKVTDAAADLFVEFAVGNDQDDCITKLKNLTKLKADLRTKVNACDAVYTECSFELAYSVLPPRDLKSISRTGIKNVVAKANSLVGTCESTFAFLGIENPATQQKLFIAKKEERGDEQLLKNLVKRVERPLKQLQSAHSRALDVVAVCVAYAYDTPKIPSMNRASSRACRPDGILLPEIDAHIEWLDRAITEFGDTSSAALEGAADISAHEGDTVVDLMPREEVFLISSFVMNLQHEAAHTLEMLRAARHLLEERLERKGRKSLHFPRIKLRKWLFSGPEEPDTVRAGDRETFQSEQPNDADITLINHDVTKRRMTRVRRKETRSRVFYIWRKSRQALGKILDWIAHSESFIYAFKFMLGVMLCAWPAFVPAWADWYSLSRGVWAPLIFVLVFENAVGSTIWIFFLRTAGTIVGSSWGFAAYQSRHGNEFTIAVMLMLGTIPNYYVQLGTKYQKAGMVCTISMCVVALSTHLQTVPGTSAENFYKRVATMLIGGTVATVVQVVLFPVKAREHLKQSLATAIVHINQMESCIASGVDDKRHQISSPALFKLFERARRKASAALLQAESFLESTKREPRLKGDFSDQAVVYKEIIYVLRQVADRMENMVQLRKQYGSTVLEQYNSRIYAYRRNVAASITLTLFVIHEALTTKLPMPQFMPSTRLAHTRMVLRIRQIILEESTQSSGTIDAVAETQTTAANHALRAKFLAWNASSAALEECIDYLEELIELTKFLVGANEFRSGLLHRPNYKEYINQIKSSRDFNPKQPARGEDGYELAETVTASGYSLFGVQTQQALEGMPDSLTRITSRRMEARLERRRTNVLSPTRDEV